MKCGLKDKELETIKEYLKAEPDAERAILFGSRAIGTHKEASDIDIAIKGKNFTTQKAQSLKGKIEDETSIPFFFDIVAHSTIKSEELLEHIRRKGKVIYNKGWRECKLGDVGEVQNGYAFKSKDFSKASGIPVIKIKNVSSGSLDMRDIWYYEKETSKLNDFVITKDDILIALTGSHIHQISSVVGRVARYDKDYPSLLNQRVGKIYSLNSGLLDEDFLYWFLKQYNITLKLAISASGSANQANISGKHIKNLKINLPPLPEQKAIAEVLSSLDDKIDLLHRQNKTLENMAQTLFRKWFIEDADESWEEKKLDEIACYLNGLACQKYPVEDEHRKLPVLKIKELKSGFSNNSDWATSEVEKKFIVNLGDVIFSWSGSLTIKIWNGEQCILNQHLFKVTSDEYPKWFYYFWTKHHLDKFIAIANAKATTMGHIKRSDLSSSIVLVPKKNQLDSMSKQVEPVFNKIVNNYKKFQTLVKVRNQLLPRLVNGTLKIE